MIIVKLQGGLGNQMFQYAFGRNAAMKKNTELKLDATSYTKRDAVALQQDTKRTFLLDKFNIVVPLASEKEINRLNPPFSKLLGKIRNKIFGFKNYYVFNPRELDVADNSYLEGYWQSERYFFDATDNIRKELTLKNALDEDTAKVSRQIESVKTSGKVTVSLHVRRSDYVSMAVNSRYFGTCSKEYYDKAFEEITKRFAGAAVELFIFSDDIEWARTNLSFPCPVHFVSNPAIMDYEELFLMSACTHHIIANSSFSWWGAWLDSSKEKIVIAPKKWLAVDTISTADIIPPSWIQI